MIFLMLDRCFPNNDSYLLKVLLFFGLVLLFLPTGLLALFFSDSAMLELRSLFISVWVVTPSTVWSYFCSSRFPSWVSS